ncbi:unnamed protein product, partial [Closterium sp. NIES-65]
ASVSSPPPINTRPNPSMQRNSSPQAWQPGLLAGQPAPHSAYVAAPSSISLTRLSSHSFSCVLAFSHSPSPFPPLPSSPLQQHQSPPRRPSTRAQPINATNSSPKPGSRAKGDAALAKLQHTNLAAILGYAADKEDMQIALILVPPSPPPAFYSLSPLLSLLVCSFYRCSKEMAALAKLQHTNLAAILGYAADKEDMQIAYDLPPNCTCLENYLFPGMLREYSPLRSDLIIYDKEDMQIAYDLPPNCTCLENYLFPGIGWRGRVLPLRVRLKVAVGIAKGLTFLHSSAVVHGNLLSRNIMLDKNFTVLLTGYGLATMLSKTSTRKNLKGPGGMAKDAFENRVARTAWPRTRPDGMAKDAFDYGVVLFELLTGRRGALVADREGADGLIAWARAAHRGVRAQRCLRRATKRMVVRMLDVLAKECVQEDPRCRPTMKDLVVRLYSLQESLHRSSEEWESGYRGSGYGGEGTGGVG